MTQTIRRGKVKDIDQLTQMLSRAFAEDPLMKYFYWNYAKNLPKTLNLFFKTCLQIILETPEHQLLIADDYSGAAFWYPPNTYKTGLFELLKWLPRIIRTIGFKGLKSMSTIMDVMDKIHPQKEHYFLMCLAVDPPSQRKGIGSSLVAPIIEQCDREGIAAYLENSSEANLNFYKKFDFKVMEKIFVKPGTPPLIPMWRDPI